MSQASSGFTPAAQDRQGTRKVISDPVYVPTAEEKRVLRECNSESFWYRSVPFSATAAGIANVLIAKGVLSPSPRFGALPKMAFFALFGYIGGKLSYMKTCQEKFMKMENSPLGEALRQGTLIQISSKMNEPDFDPKQSESQQSGSESVHEPATEVSSGSESYSSYTSDYTYSTPSQSYEPTPFSSGFSDSGPANIRDDFPSQAPLYIEEDVPRKKPVLYEELRNKNRENYEVTLPQKNLMQMKPHTEVKKHKKEDKENKYGDSWED